MPCAPSTKKPRAGTCWRPPTDATIRSAWQRWHWPRRGWRRVRRRPRSSRPFALKDCYRRTQPGTTEPKTSVMRRSRSKTRATSRTLVNRPVPATPRSARASMNMSHGAPLGALALACAILSALPLRPITAAEIPPEQRQAIEAIIHDYLLQNPDVLIEALRAAEEKANHDAKAAVVLKDRRGEVFDDPATPVGGNPQGDVTIVEFFDYRCPYCKQVQPTLQTLLDQDRRLCFVYKEMPVLGPSSVLAAHAALAAQRQDKYEAFHTAMMAAKGQITEDVVYKIAGSVGLDLDRLKHDMAEP